jgi:DNA-binding XRE family transcriptional regulator
LLLGFALGRWGRDTQISTNFVNIDVHAQHHHLAVMSLTAPQCRAARALLDWTQADLAERAAVSAGTVRGFESNRHALHRATAAAIRQALEAAGIRFLEADAAGGEGVRRACPPLATPGCPEATPPL